MLEKILAYYKLPKEGIENDAQEEFSVVSEITQLISLSEELEEDSATPHIPDPTLKHKYKPTTIMKIQDTSLAPNVTLPDHSAGRETPSRSEGKVSARPHSLIDEGETTTRPERTAYQDKAGGNIKTRKNHAQTPSPKGDNTKGNNQSRFKFKQSQDLNPLEPSKTNLGNRVEQ